jgi:hypothetical protein
MEGEDGGDEEKTESRLKRASVSLASELYTGPGPMIHFGSHSAKVTSFVAQAT